MEDLVDKLRRTFQGSNVLVTGHTGFKGAWLCEWLLSLGARVTGFALAPESNATCFEKLNLGQRIDRHMIGDVRDFSLVETVLRETAPSFLFHLAAQALVSVSYEDPLQTYSANVLGTAHILEALRRVGRSCVAVVITSDKCYENQNRSEPYHEGDPLGGSDPYSSSKACAELVCASYRRSFFSEHRPIALASARAGNVIGGGDWSRDRIVPDCVRALRSKRAIVVRNPGFVRPWQHVLEPLAGYLALAAEIDSAVRAEDNARLDQLCSAFNFGPRTDSSRTVRELVETILTIWSGRWEDGRNPKAPHEAHRLTLASEKAERILGWRPVWNFEQSVLNTIKWYRTMQQPAHDIQKFTHEQIEAFEQASQVNARIQRHEMPIR
jgi:CDP-glucose 4,6-dehydratase